MIDRIFEKIEARFLGPNSMEQSKIYRSEVDALKRVLNGEPCDKKQAAQQEQDARRYRFLRDELYHSNSNIRVLVGKHAQYGEELDEAIDNAMLAHEGA